MTSDRCPACNAAVPAAAQWCTLCYTVLRAPEPVPATVPATHAIAEYRPSTAAIAQSTLDDQALPPDPILDAPVMVAPPVAGAKPAGWPCLGCGAVVPMEDDACSGCGRAFLTAGDLPSLGLPGVGDLRSLDRGQKIAVMGVGAVVVMGLLVALAFILGSVL